VIGFAATDAYIHLCGFVSGRASGGRGVFGNPNDFRNESPPVLSSILWLW
jgi:hypothetical protein